MQDLRGYGTSAAASLTAP